MKILDALGVIFATVKAASTAAAAADTALVVAVSPNNVLKAGDGTNVAKVQAASIRPAAADLSQTVSLSPNMGITTMFSLNSAATTNATLLKATAGSLMNLRASNSGAAVAYLKLFNMTTAPTVGSSIPVTVIPIPAGGNANFDIHTLGQPFTTGISYCITNLMPDADATAIAAGQVKVFGSYI